jgi:hypothetical protein
MICPICRLESPTGALRCDCGYEFSQGSTVVVNQAPPSRSTKGSPVASIFWLLTILGSLAGAFTLTQTFSAAKSAPQEAAGAALAAALAVIPYCLARAVGELAGLSRR